MNILPAFCVLYVERFGLVSKVESNQGQPIMEVSDSWLLSSETVEANNSEGQTKNTY